MWPYHHFSKATAGEYFFHAACCSCRVWRTDWLQGHISQECRRIHQLVQVNCVSIRKENDYMRSIVLPSCRFPNQFFRRIAATRIGSYSWRRGWAWYRFLCGRVDFWCGLSWEHQVFAHWPRWCSCRFWWTHSHCIRILHVWDRLLWNSPSQLASRSRNWRAARLRVDLLGVFQGKVSWLCGELSWATGWVCREVWRGIDCTLLLLSVRKFLDRCLMFLRDGDSSPLRRWSAAKCTNFSIDWCTILSFRPLAWLLRKLPVFGCFTESTAC